MIYLLRHGKTTWNQEGRLQGCGPKEGTLLETSLLELDRISKALENIDFDLFYVSPLQRTTQSFQRLSLQLSHPPVFDDRLRELDFGIYDGQIYRELPPIILQSRENDPFDFVWEGGESYRQADARIKSFIKDFDLQNHEGKNIGIMAHQIINTSLSYNLTLAPEYLDLRQQHTDIIQISGKQITIQSV